MALGAFFLLVFAYYTWPRESSFSVAAATEYLTIERTNSPPIQWYLPKVTLCRPGEIEGGKPDDTCGDGRRRHTISEADVVFHTGYGLTFRGFENNTVELVVTKREGLGPVFLTGLRELPDGGTQDVSLSVENNMNLTIHFDARDRPSIEARGRVQIGELPSNSGGLILQSATYEIRQALLFGDPFIVARGAALPGDQLIFINHDPPDPGAADTDEASTRSRSVGSPEPAATEPNVPPQVDAHVFITDLSRSSAFQVVLTTPLEYSSIGLTRIGADLTPVPVSWTARLANDPFPAAIGTLIGLLGALLALSNAYLAPPRKEKVETNGDASKG